MKRILAVLLCALLLCGTALADNGFVEWEFDPWRVAQFSDGLTAITGYTGSKQEVTLETSIGLFYEQVTGIGSIVFNDELRGVFAGTEVEKVIIPKGIVTVFSNPFIKAEKLTEIELQGNTAFKVEDGVLFSADGKALLGYPGGLTAQSYTVPDGTVSLIDYAFAYQPNLTLVVIPASVTELGEGVFEGCENLIVSAPSGSAAEAYCAEHGITCAPAWGN